MRESLYFNYDGINSEEMGLVNVSLSSGLYEETFLPTRKLSEVAVKGKNKPYFQSIDSDPLEFSLTFAFDKGYTSNGIREVAQWLYQDYYKPLYFRDRHDASPKRIFYCICVNDSKHVHNGLQQGYLELNFRCNSPFSYSEYQFSETYNVENEQMIEFNNLGDFDVLPEISIKKIGKGSLSIESLSDSNVTFVFDELADNESIYLDCEGENIISDLFEHERYDNFNDGYLKLSQGINRLLVKGSCELRFRYQYTYLQG